MTLTNYWWLLIWIFIGGLLAFFIPKQQELVNGRKVERWTMPTALILIAPYIVWAGFRSNAFGDTEAYRIAFRNAPSALGELSTYLAENTKDQGFSVLMVLMKGIIGNSDKLFFLLIAAFQLFCVVYFFRKYSTDFLLCLGEQLCGELALHVHEFLHQWLILLKHLVVALGYRT